MDSKRNRLFSSTTQATATPPATDAPKVSYYSPSGIRAPLTVDSDIDCYLSINENSSSGAYSTGSVSESDNSLVSVEEEFVETRPVRPFVANPDDETIEETLYLKYAGSSEQSLEVGKYGDSRSFVDGADEETSEETTLEGEGEDDYVLHDDEAPVVDIGVSLLPKPAMPIAQLSANGDDDSVISGVVEDDGFSGAVHVRMTVLSDDLDTAPRVKVLCVGDEEDESESVNVLEPEVVEDLISAEAISVVVSSCEGDMVNDTVEDSHDLDVIKEVNFDSLVASKNFVSLEDSNLDDNEKHVAEEVDLENSGKEEINNVKIDEKVALETDLVSTGMVIDNNEERITEEGSTVAAAVSPVVEYLVNSEYLEADKIIGSTDEAGLVVNRKGPDDSIGLDSRGGVIYGWESGNDNKQSETEERAESVVESCDSVAAEKTESMNGAIGVNDKQRMDFTESHLPETTEIETVEDETCAKFDILELNVDAEIKKGGRSGCDAENNILGNSNTEKKIAAELEQGLDYTSSAGRSSHDRPHGMEESVVYDSDVDVETDGKIETQEIFDSSALIAFLKAATAAGSVGDSSTLPRASADGSSVFPIDRPVGLGSSFLPARLTPQSKRSNSSLKLTSGADREEILSEAEKEKLKKLQQIQVIFMRIVWRLGQSFENSVVAHVLRRLAIAAERSCSKVFSFDSARRAAMELEVNGDNDLSFSLNVLVIGKTGVGKSATINTIFGEEKTITSAFEPATAVVQEIIGTVDGVKLRVLDTPGLLSSQEGQRYNRKILSSIKKIVKKFPPDVVLYVDRADTPTRDFNDLPMVQSITSYLGSSIWRNTIITLTHVTSTPLDGPSGYSSSFDAFVDRKSCLVRRLIGHAGGDLQIANFGSLNAVSLVDNNPLHDTNENGESWRSHLLLLCYSMKILSETSSLVKTNSLFDHQNLFGFRLHSPPVLHFLSQLLQSRAYPKLPGDMEIELECMFNSDEVAEHEYDQLPPFKPLKKSQVTKLTKEQRKAYFEEYDYREKLFQKKQWREEMKRLNDLKKKDNNCINYDVDIGDYGYEETENPSIAETSHEIAVPPSFDSDTPAYRYRILVPTSQRIVQPVPCVNKWDHDHGFDGVFYELNLAIAGQFPTLIAVNLKKDKEEFKLNLNSCVSAKYSKNISTMAGVGMQTFGKQLAYVLKGETEVKMFKVNRMASGLSLVLLGENVMPGFKIEDRVMVGKQMALVGTAVAVRSQGNSAYSANMEVRFREKDFPIGQDQTTIGLCLTKWRDELLWGCNLQSQFGLGRSSKLVVHTSLNNKLNGKISITSSSSEQLQIAILGLLPLARTIIRNYFPRLREKYSI